MLDLRDDRRSDRRGGDRRYDGSQSGARRTERRSGSRRRKLAGVGLLAAATFAGVKSYNPHGYSPWGFGSSSALGTVDVQEDNFRLPSYDRAALEPYIQEAAAMHGVSPDLVRAVVQTESHFNPLAVSPVGAKGLMQLMPSTAKHMGLDNPFDPRENVLAGAKYLSLMLDRFNGNTALALAGYNAGPENVRRYRGVPPFGETRGYVKKIQNLVAGSEAAFSIPVAPKSRVRRASLHATRAKVGRARHVNVSRPTTLKVRAKAPASRARARNRGTRA